MQRGRRTAFRGDFVSWSVEVAAESSLMVALALRAVGDTDTVPEI